MEVTEKLLETNGMTFDSYTEEFVQLADMTNKTLASKVFCVNPRDGTMIAGFMARNAVIDSFVSDEEWTDAAKSFSERVYTGDSHHQLLEIHDESYDLVFVCEDFALVDDCDEMARQYYRILKHGGSIFCGIWNMSYYKYLDELLSSNGTLSEDFNNPLHGKYSMAIDTLRMRFERLGFSAFIMTAYCPVAKVETIEKYIQITKNMEIPANTDYFLTKIFFIEAIK